MDRRQFAAAGLATIGSLFLPPASFTRTAGRTRLMLSSGRRDFTYGMSYQSELRRVISAARAHGLRVTIREIPRVSLPTASLRRWPPMAATRINPNFVVHSGRLPAAFVVNVLRGWFAAAPERRIVLWRHGSPIYAYTPDQMEELCRQL